MTLVKWNPRRSLFDFPRGIDQFFETFFSPISEEEASIPAFNPAVDIKEKEKELQVTAELPGINKEDVKVSLKDDLLTISGEKKSKKEVKDENHYRMERVYGSFHRCFRLPNIVDSENISADFKDGVLNIRIPKLKEALPKQIEVKIK